MPDARPTPPPTLLDVLRLADEHATAAADYRDAIARNLRYDHPDLLDADRRRTAARGRLVDVARHLGASLDVGATSWSTIPADVAA